MPPCSDILTMLSQLRAKNHRIRHAVAATEALIEMAWHTTPIKPADAKALY